MFYCSLKNEPIVVFSWPISRNDVVKAIIKPKFIFSQIICNSINALLVLCKALQLWIEKLAKPYFLVPTSFFMFVAQQENPN
jgi:hypothetical protein